MILIDGKQTAAEIREELKKEVSSIKKEKNQVPGLTVILIGDLAPSQIYVRMKEKAADEVGLKSEIIKYPNSIDEKTILDKINELNKDNSVSGILVQLPLPKHIDKQKVIETISPLKDVDGFHPYNFGNLSLGNQTVVPCTPLGSLYLIKNEVSNLNGKNAVIIGRSNIVGKPMHALLLKENCTVTLAHSKTKKLHDITKKADILIAAIGKAEFIKKNHIKPNSLIIDIGINRITKKGESIIVGDVMFNDAYKIASKITPVPGGVGPMTIACLMYNTVKLSFLRQKFKFDEKLF